MVQLNISKSYSQYVSYSKLFSAAMSWAEAQLSRWHSNCENHHISIRCMYHQLGKYMMERIGRYGTGAVCPLLSECRTCLRGRLWPRIQHSGHMWRLLSSVEEDETPVLHRLEDGTGYLCWHRNEGSSSSQLECWCCWRHDGGDYQIHGSFVFVPLGCPPYRCPRQHLFEPRVAT